MNLDGFLRIKQLEKDEIVAFYVKRGARVKIKLRLCYNETIVWGAPRACFGISLIWECPELKRYGILVSGGPAEKVKKVKESFALEEKHLNAVVQALEETPNLETAFWRAVRNLENLPDLANPRLEPTA